jgi:hypothetical protein
MALPVPANTTCDLYRFNNHPPSPPDVAAVPCHLQGDFTRRMETGEKEVPSLRYTHVLLVDVSVDVRDGFTTWPPQGQPGPATNYDQVFVPNQNGTLFKVVFVERCGRGTAADHKRVYLDRGAPTWPSNDL